MTRYAFTVEYDGRPFVGWQRQPNGPSVQQAIEHAITQITGETVSLHGAGRTDAGVHGIAMRAHADIAKSLTPFRMMEALNAKMRAVPVAITACEIVADDWHARFSCIGRSYVYRIVNRRPPLTWETGLAWRIRQPLDTQAMQKAAQQLLGLHDFTTFRSAHCQSANPIKTLARLDIIRTGDRIDIHAAARSFLHHQVRSMVGCLGLVGLGKWTVDDLRDALEAKDRTALGLNAPPDGLYFVSAVY